MGQSTNDNTLAELENQYLLQQRLIKEATSAMAQVENKDSAVLDCDKSSSTGLN